MKLPEHLLPILDKITKSGFTPFIVGGAIRDYVIGITPKDFDVEVLGCSIDQLHLILSEFGPVKEVGKKFGILTMFNEFDFSIPRMENKIGIGHKDFNCTFDPNITPKEAAARRDFTFNALCYNPLTDEVLDFFGGIDDIKNKIIRHTSIQFNEDPLRVLRAIQFQSRLGFTIADETIIEMRKMLDELYTLPIERISEEMMKWAIKGKNPELLLDFVDQMPGLFPCIGLLPFVPHDHKFHPEGHVGGHTKLCLRKIIDICDRENIIEEDKAVLVFTMLLHDIGKLTTTAEEWVEKYQALSRGHIMVQQSLVIQRKHHKYID